MCLSIKETTLERAAFQAGWSELSWSGRTRSLFMLKITGTTAHKNGENYEHLQTLTAEG